MHIDEVKNTTMQEVAWRSLLKGGPRCVVARLECGHQIILRRIHVVFAVNQGASKCILTIKGSIFSIQ